ncbi:MAG TPA: tetratricopeptide repeat protein [Patescibacteria group bacterium]|nr:tetratricopeptide repeat protein [Patescibacteria group bacterium]
MYSLLPFILISLSLVIIAVIVVRKFPQLTLLDVDSIPEVKLARKKEELMRKRLDAKAEIWDKKSRKMFQPFVRWAKGVQLAFRQYVGRVHGQILKVAAKKEQTKKVGAEEIKAIMRQGEEALANKDYEGAEKKFIEVIRLKPKNQEAYLNLGKVYQAQGELTEAGETLDFLLRLNPDHDQAIVLLAEMAEAQNQLEAAIDYYQRSLLLTDNNPARFLKLADLLEKIGKYEPALEAIQQAADIEPQNPKYLDRLVEVSVKCGNKELAEKAYSQLRMVNPENNKLSFFREQIDGIK